jgi:hypothetical protein
VVTPSSGPDFRVADLLGGYHRSFISAEDAHILDKIEEIETSGLAAP